jgi:hypothetical protein
MLVNISVKMLRDCNETFYSEKGREQRAFITEKVSYK